MIGHPLEPNGVPETGAPPETAGRVHLPLTEFVFGARWGEPAPTLELAQPVRP